MIERRILLLNAAGLRALRWQREGVRFEASFAAEQAGLDAFQAYLQEHSHALYYLLADLASETFEIQPLPPVRGTDRLALLKRKQEQLFADTALSLALSLGRESGGRRDERILFAAFTQPAQFEPWLHRLRSNQVRLVGIYSLPFVSHCLLPRTRENENLVLTTLSAAGLRQTHFDAGQPQFSRLTPLPAAAGAAELARLIDRETAHLCGYLAHQQLIARNSALRVLIVAQPTLHRAIAPLFQTPPLVHYEFFDLHAAAGQWENPIAAEASFADFPLAHALASRPSAAQFAPRSERHHYRLWQIKRVLRAGALALVCTGALFCAHQLFRARALADEAAQLALQSQREQAEYAALVASMPDAPLPSADLRALMKRWQALRQHSPPPEQALNEISAALADLPQIELQRLTWRLAHGADGGGAKANAAESLEKFVVVEIEAELPAALAQDRRGQQVLMEGFAEKLRQQRKSEVRIDRQPFDLESGKALHSNAERERGADKPRFALRYIVEI